MSTNDQWGARAPGRLFWRQGLYVAMAAAAFNTVLFLAGYLLDIVTRPALFNSARQPGLLIVVGLSLAAVIAAFAFYRALATRLRSPAPVFVSFVIPIAAFSFLAPMAMGAWPRDQVVLFELMHLAVIMAILVALRQWQGKAAC